MRGERFVDFIEMEILQRQVFALGVSAATAAVGAINSLRRARSPPRHMRVHQ